VGAGEGIFLCVAGLGKVGPQSSRRPSMNFFLSFFFFHSNGRLPTFNRPRSEFLIQNFQLFPWYPPLPR
jgi:hypothetical protein